jgi:hypothetical protein
VHEDAAVNAKRQKFVNYLTGLLPLLQNNFQHSGDPLLQKLANPEYTDYLLPFRQRAPTMELAMITIYSDPDELRTPVGLFNALCFRGVFYGSPWARKRLRWFDSYNDWIGYHKLLGREDSHFVNLTCYGSCQVSRELSNIEIYWQKCNTWPTFLGPSNSTPSLEKIYKYLLSFHNIGKLSALLLIGDFIESRVIEMPSAKCWGEFVGMVGMGALKGLQNLGLLKSKASSTDVQIAFTGLHDYIIDTISQDDLELMGYNVVMLEHGLCKLNRVGRLL